uniref:Uncharacterized protein n=1 Tax=Pyxicephalus adspersus TaxID=30357 RepID=A0AAV3B2C5_PYXAD|nr:TPA: hypothetical protein GDO54_009501 [Pyxicephalus adspersus]
MLKTPQRINNLFKLVLIKKGVFFHILDMYKSWGKKSYGIQRIVQVGMSPVPFIFQISPPSYNNNRYKRHIAAFAFTSFLFLFFSLCFCFCLHYTFFLQNL